MPCTRQYRQHIGFPIGGDGIDLLSLALELHLFSLNVIICMLVSVRPVGMIGSSSEEFSDFGIDIYTTILN